MIKPPDYYAGVIRQLEARVAVLDTACDELQMQLSSAQIYAESVEELYAEQLEAAKAGQGWEVVPQSLEYDLIMHAIYHGEIPNGYQICRRVAQAAAGDGAGKATNGA